MLCFENALLWLENSICYLLWYALYTINSNLSWEHVQSQYKIMQIGFKWMEGDVQQIQKKKEMTEKRRGEPLVFSLKKEEERE